MIADDLFASGFDFFAGGRFHNTPDSAEHAAENGYVILSSPAETASADEKVILSSNLVFGDYGVSPAIDGGARDRSNPGTDAAEVRQWPWFPSMIATAGSGWTATSWPGATPRPTS